MIYLIIKSYLAVFVSIALVSISLLFAGLYFIFRTVPRASAASASKTPVEVDDLSAIAGEDLIATQMDLARAYIETGKQQPAIAILSTIIKQGSPTQQEEARTLLAQHM